MCESVQVNIKIGHGASLRKEPTTEGYTHDWKVFIKSCNGEKIQHYIEKVVFYLHQSFPNPIRVFNTPPYSVTMSGYAGFDMPIDIHFKNDREVTIKRFVYDLFLPHTRTPILNERMESCVFDSPSEEFMKCLLLGGGMILTNSNNNSITQYNQEHSFGSIQPPTILSAGSDNIPTPCQDQSKKSKTPKSSRKGKRRKQDNPNEKTRPSDSSSSSECRQGEEAKSLSQNQHVHQIVPTEIPEFKKKRGHAATEVSEPLLKKARIGGEFEKHEILTNSNNNSITQYNQENSFGSIQPPTILSAGSDNIPTPCQDQSKKSKTPKSSRKGKSRKQDNPNEKTRPSDSSSSSECRQGEEAKSLSQNQHVHQIVPTEIPEFKKKRRHAATEVIEPLLKKARLGGEFEKLENTLYIQMMRDVHKKIIAISTHPSLTLWNVVQVIMANGPYKEGKEFFECDLQLLDQATVKKLHKMVAKPS